MRCDDARGEISAWIDDALPSDRRQTVAGHVASCEACRAVADDYRRIGRRLGAIGREPPPADLARTISSRLDTEDGAVVSSGRRNDWPRLLRQAAALLLVAGLSAAATFAVTRSGDAQARIEHDIAAAHIRSLLQESPIQIASADTHTVKPWFTGRIDFPVTVLDLEKDGFPLAGGRLDYVAGQRSAALVYRRRLHTINVFVWPSGQAEAAAQRLVAVKGYNAVSWAAKGMQYWAVSDLNAAELQQFATLF